MGGGVIRTAAKAAVIGGYRSAGGPIADAAAARRAGRPASATVFPAASTGESEISVALQSNEDVCPHAPLAMENQRPAWDFNDWEFVGGQEEELFDAIHPTPRTVFGPVPTFKEAKEATSDLKDAFENVYLSSNAAVEPLMSSQGSTASENSAILPAVSKHVAQAFTLLQGSTEVQNVVASLASDKNMWDAMLKNEGVLEFYKNHESAFPPKTILEPEESATNGNAEESVEGSETSESGLPDESVEGSETSESGLPDWVNDIKLKVSEIVSNISDWFQDFMGPSTGASGTKASTHIDSPVEITIGASFLVLAVAAILVVLVKRGA